MGCSVCRVRPLVFMAVLRVQGQLFVSGGRVVEERAVVCIYC